jgi:hypothetical protein
MARWYKARAHPTLQIMAPPSAGIVAALDAPSCWFQAPAEPSTIPAVSWSDVALPLSRTSPSRKLLAGSALLLASALPQALACAAPGAHERAAVAAHAAAPASAQPAAEPAVVPEPHVPPQHDLHAVARGDDIFLHQLDNAMLVASGAQLFELSNGEPVAVRDWAVGLPSMEPQAAEPYGYLVTNTFLFAGRWPDSAWLAAMDAEESGGSRVFRRERGRWSVVRRQRNGSVLWLGPWGEAGYLGWFEGQNGAARELFALGSKPKVVPVLTAAGAGAQLELQPARMVALRSGDVFVPAEDAAGRSVLLHWAPGAKDPLVEPLPCPGDGAGCGVRDVRLLQGPNRTALATGELREHVGRVEQGAVHGYLAQWNGTRWSAVPAPPTGLRLAGAAVGAHGALWVIADGFTEPRCKQPVRGQIWRQRAGEDWQEQRFPDAPARGGIPGHSEPVQLMADPSGRMWVVLQSKTGCDSDDRRVMLLSDQALSTVADLAE